MTDRSLPPDDTIRSPRAGAPAGGGEFDDDAGVISGRARRSPESQNDEDATIVQPRRRSDALTADGETIVRPRRASASLPDGDHDETFARARHLPATDDATTLASRRATSPASDEASARDAEPESLPDTRVRAGAPSAGDLRHRTAYSPGTGALRAVVNTGVPGPAMARRSDRPAGGVPTPPVSGVAVERAVRSRARSRALAVVVAASAVFLVALGLLITLVQTWH
ncbi:MAG: hypothetical protein KKH75_06595 [Actinobacteria bacterium]|nr:hypothetical protein [Actinomycetota bacterium]